MASLSEYSENTSIANIGAQSITISYKPGSIMHCFLCGNLNVRENDMKTCVPICNTCLKKYYSKYYTKKKRPRLNYTYLIHPTFNIASNNICEYCGREYQLHRIFDYYGFAKNVCSSCLKDPLINIDLSNNYIQPIWTQRK